VSEQRWTDGIRSAIGGVVASIPPALSPNRPAWDPLTAAAAFVLLGAGVVQAVFRGGDGGLVVDVVVTVAAGAAILLSFLSAIRIITSEGRLRGGPVAIGLCVVSIAYVLAVYVPAVIRPRGAPAAAVSTSACEQIAPLVSRWLAGLGPIETAMPNHRIRELSAWRARLASTDLDARLASEQREVDAVVGELQALWETRAQDATQTSSVALAEARARATTQIRRLGAACVE
jgi:hypothetical protein